MNTIAAIFAKQFSRWGITLPGEGGIVQCQGVIHQQGWTIYFRCGVDEAGDTLDYYATHRMTNDRHVRIHEDGRVEMLDAILDAVVYSEDSTPEQRRQIEEEYYAHNQRVAAELRAKGFL
jgi:hypothetical protein